MKSGYDQFFKKARTMQAAETPSSSSNLRRTKDSKSKSASAQRSLSNDEKNAQTLAFVQNIAKELAENRQPKSATTHSIKKRKRGSIQSLSISIFGFIICMVGLLFYKEVESKIKSFEISLFGSAIASEGSASSPANSADKSALEKPSKDPNAKDLSTASEERNSEKKVTSDSSAKIEKREGGDQEHLSKLQDRKKELDQREEELNRVEAELATQKIEIEKKLKNLEEVRDQISNALKERVKTDSTKVESLVQVYSNMKAPQAARIFETMDEDLAIEILGRMKKKNAADIMNLLKPEKAQAFSEKFAGYRVPASK